jgi:hypothetical protein
MAAVDYTAIGMGGKDGTEKKVTAPLCVKWTRASSWRKLRSTRLNAWRTDTVRMPHGVISAMGFSEKYCVYKETV